MASSAPESISEYVRGPSRSTIASRLFVRITSGETDKVEYFDPERVISVRSIDPHTLVDAKTSIYIEGGLQIWANEDVSTVMGRIDRALMTRHEMLS